MLGKARRSRHTRETHGPVGSLLTSKAQARQALCNPVSSRRPADAPQQVTPRAPEKRALRGGACAGRAQCRGARRRGSPRLSVDLERGASSGPARAQPPSPGASRLATAAASPRARLPAGSGRSDSAHRVWGRRACTHRSEPPWKPSGAQGRQRCLPGREGPAARSCPPSAAFRPSPGGRTHGGDGHSLPEEGRRAPGPARPEPCGVT